MNNKCTICGKGSNYYNEKFKTNICEECFEKYYSDISGIEAFSEPTLTQKEMAIYEAIDNRIKRTPYTNNLEELLSALKESELKEILVELRNEKSKVLKKEKLIELILSSYEEKLKYKLNLLDENIFKMLNKFYQNNGERLLINVPVEEEEYIDYFISLGVIFPTKIKEDKPVFIMPKETRKIIKSINDFQYRLNLRNNSNIIKLYIGMIRAYGVLKVNDLTALVKEYLNEELEEDYLSSVLVEASKYNTNFKIKDEYAFAWNIENFLTLYKDINKLNKNLDYKKFTYDELLSLGVNNWEIDNEAAKEFKNKFAENRFMSEYEANELLEVFYGIVQERSLEFIINSVNEFIPNGKSKEIFSNIVKDYVINLPVWLKKGRSLKDSL